MTGLIAGLLSGRRPVRLPAVDGAQGQGWSVRAPSGRVRQGLVVQFSVLICLMIVGATIWRQTAFALTSLLRLNEDQIVYFG